MSYDHRQFDALRLLAKSLPSDVPRSDPSAWPEATTLPRHLADVARVAETICETASDAALRNLGLEPDAWRDAYRDALTTAAWLHDLGKANSRFQAMLHRQRDLGQQPVRHEAISAWIALQPSLLGDQLFPGGLDKNPVNVCAVLAVLGHHVKFCVRGPALQPGVSDPTATGDVRILLDHPDLRASVEQMGLTLDHQAIQLSGDDLLEGNAHYEGLRDLVESLYDALVDQRFYDGREPLSALDNDWGRLLALVKSTLVTADVIGSAVVREKGDPADWARGALTHAATAEVFDGVVQKRLEECELRDFQHKIAQAPISGDGRARVTVALAGCGSGKTVAAYAWAAQRADKRKLFFAYPTTGTATEGFGDYVKDVDLEAALVHGRAIVDLERLYTNSSGANADADTDGDDSDADTLAKLRGLEMLHAEVCVCTVDAVLGLVQNHRRGLTAAAAIASGAFVFDEVHAFDASLWAALLAFLRLFPGAPVLLMSASLSETRRRELVEALNGERNVNFIAGPEDLETLPRYTLETSDRDDALARAARAAQEGRRVLVVTNTVGRCMEYRNALIKRLGDGDDRPDVLVYHSRFRYEDRVDRHGEVIKRFAGAAGDRGVIAVTTQVAEMSLDLDADLLVTDLAPAPSLIQRMGRLNRRARPGVAPRPCVIIELGSDIKDVLPYTHSLLDQARQWRADLPEGPLSQRGLADAFDRLSTTRDAQSVSPPITLITAPVEACRGQLRESGVTAPFLLKRDAQRARAQGKGGRPDPDVLIRATLSMTLPRWWRYQDWEQLGLAHVIPDGFIDYDPLLGAAWRRDADQGGA